MKRLLFIACVWLFGIGTMGARPEVSTVWKNIFHTMENWNLPDVTEATVVQPAISRVPEISQSRFAYAWLTAEQRAEDGPPEWGELVADGFRRLQVEWNDKTKVVPQPPPSIYTTPEPPPSVLYGTWEPLTISDLVESVIKSLQDARWSGRRDTTQQSRCAVLAYQLWTRGDRDALPSLLEELEQADGGGTGILHELIQFLAAVEYEEIYLTWLADADWLKYRNAVLALMEKYGEAWDGHPVMQRLADFLAPRIAWEYLHTRAEMPPTSTHMLERVLFVKALRNPTWPQWDSTLSTWWLFPSTWSHVAPSPPDVELELYRLGIHAIPLLVSWIHDSMPMNVDREELARGGRHILYSPMKFSSLSAARFPWTRKRELNEIFDSEIPRPATRGEVAQRWLNLILPKWVSEFIRDEDNQAKALAREAKRFYRAWSDASEVGVALQYLSPTYWDFHAPLVSVLLDQAKSRRLPEVEEFLLSRAWDSPDEQHIGSRLAFWRAKADVIVMYVLRQPEAEWLLPAYMAATEEYAADELETAANPKRTDQERQRAQGIAGQLADFQKLLHEYQRSIPDVQPLLTPSDVVAFVERREDYNLSVLLKKVDTFEPDARLEALLAVAVFSTITNRHNRVLEAASPRRLIPPSYSSTAAADYWRRLFDDESGLYPRTVGDMFLLLNERLFAAPPDENMEYNIWTYKNAQEARAGHFLNRYGRAGSRWLRGRVEQRLAGVPEEMLPSYEEVDAALSEPGLLRNVESALREASSREEARRVIEGLTPIQRMALPAVLTRHPDLNARLFEWASILDTVDLSEVPGLDSSRFSQWIGKPVSLALAQEMVAFAAECVSKDESTQIWFVYREDMGGCSLRILPMPRKKGNELIAYRQQVCASDVYGHIVTRVVDGAHVKGPAHSGQFAQMKFQSAVEQIFQTGLPALEERFLVIQTEERW